ncbi:MAG TPA: SDR family oxidoreductase [Geminicoccaceae bacterium]|nr:SDR family oxidoreductase [Geminicoccaceae bacterium]
MADAGKELEGRVALITGAVRRIGRAIALALARDGAAIVINTRSSKDEAAAVAAEVEALGAPAMVHLADVTDEAAVQAMVDAALARFGRLDILVNNAADRQQAPLTEISLAQWRHITGIIVDGAFLCARACLPPMLAAGGGTIINIGGATAHIGAHHRAHVVTAKAALIGLTKAIAVEFADRGVTANCVVPGRIGGARSQTAGEAPPMGGGAAPLVGRAGTPEEVAAMVRQLCLPVSRYITGQTIHVSGGTVLP